MSHNHSFKHLSFLSIPVRLALMMGLLIVALGTTFVILSLAQPGNPDPDPDPNTHTAPLTTTVSITYDEPINATTVTSRTFAVHGMQSGLVTETHGVVNGGYTIIVTPTNGFFPGELVYAVATTQTTNITGTHPLTPTLWQFTAGRVDPRCVAGFSDIEAGLTGVKYSSVAWGDYDNDGDLDILMAGDSGSGYIADVWRNEGGGTFTPISAGLTGVENGSVAWGDYDNDGYLDILLAGGTVEAEFANPVSNVYHNNGNGTFSDISAALTAVDDAAAAWGDYDNDGDLDILLAGDSGIGTYIADVWRNDGGGTFAAISAGLNGLNNGFVAWGDYDNDGWLDILLTGDASSAPNAQTTDLWHNDTDGTFIEITTSLSGVAGSSVSWGDYDNDGDLDIALAGSHTSAPPEFIAEVWRNDGGGTFTDISAGLTGVQDGTIAWGDYDNDGDLDILLVGDTGSGSMSKVYRNDSGATFTDTGAELTGIGQGSAAWGDYDNDGDLDILLTGQAFDDETMAWVQVAQVYRNDDCPDLSISKAVYPATAAPGDTITYTITFTNTGGALASGVVITDIVPVSVTNTSVISSGSVAITDTLATPPYVWEVADLASGASGVIIITGQLSATLATGTFTNTAVITTTAVDSDPGNNSDTAAITIPPADLVVTKTVTP